MKMRVPFFPPDIFEDDREAIYTLFQEVGAESRHILGKRVKTLEDMFCTVTGAKHAIAVHSGTGAIAVSLRAMNIGPGDEVIVQGFCCQPVASEVLNVGATPVFCDVTRDTMVMDPADAESRITPRTRAILPAHLFSEMVDMPAINAVAQRHDLLVLEDACVQQGAAWGGITAGRFGLAGTFSFFQQKVMGGIGEGGLILTDNDALAQACRMVRNHGQDGQQRFLHHRIGVNSRMDELMAGFLMRRLEGMQQLLDRRIAVAEYYHDRFATIADRVELPRRESHGRCYYMFVLRSERRDALQRYLWERGIATQCYYPRPLPQQRAFEQLKREDSPLPHCYHASRTNIALPIYPNLSHEDAELVADKVVEFFNT